MVSNKKIGENPVSSVSVYLQEHFPPTPLTPYGSSREMDPKMNLSPAKKTVFFRKKG